MITLDFAHSTGAKTQILSKKELSRIIDSAYVKSLCEEIAAETDDKRRSALKKKLAVFLWHAHFPSSHRVNADAEPSGLIMLDLDHVENPRDLFEQIKERAINEFGLVAAHVSCSGTGLRLVFPVPEGMTLAQAMKYYERVLSLPNVDKACKDYARSSYVVPRDYFLYIDEEVLFGDKELMKVVPKPEELALLEEKSKKKRTSKQASSGEQPELATTGNCDYNKEQLTAIVEALEEQLGGKPGNGDRNNFLYLMVCHLKNICNNPDVLFQILPDYGDDGDEQKMATIKSALSKPKEGMSTALRRAIKMAGGRTEEENDLPPAMPEKLPELVDLLVKHLPEVTRPSCAVGVFAPLATHLNNCKFVTTDGSVKEATVMAVTIAEQGRGKSSIHRPLAYINRDIEENDKIARQKDDEYRKQLSRKGANKEKPERPDVYWQIIEPNATSAGFIDRADMAKGRYLFSDCPEFTPLEKMGEGKRNSHALLRLAYDNDWYGSERVGPQSVNKRIKVRINLTISSTVQQAKKYLDQEALANGTLSRLTLATVNENNRKPFLYTGPYRDVDEENLDEDFYNLLKPFIDNLKQTHGHIECKEALEMAKEMQKRYEDKCALSEDTILMTLSRRAIMSAFIKACVLYVANGCKWEPEFATFANWALDYDLWCKMHFFGNEMAQAMQNEQTKPHRGKKNLLEQLAETFTSEQLKNVRIENGLSGNPKQMLANWVFRGFIRKDENGSYTKLAS